MKIVKCINGHFFDSETYKLCPHCGEIESTHNTNRTKMMKNNEKRESFIKDFLSSIKKNKEEPTVNSFGYYFDNEVFQNDDINNLPTTNEVQKDDNLLTEKTNNTVGAWDILDIDVSHNESDNTEIEIIYDEKDVSDADQTDNNDEFDNLKSTVENVSASNEDKTMSYFSIVNSAKENENLNGIQSEPVVGWIICISGVHFGESFNIVSGKNSIGRNTDNKIILNKDMKISRNKHALIIYEPKNREFYLQPGDSSGLTYLNNEYITETKKMNNKDVFELGNSKFMLIPLCDESFSWEKFL